MRLEKKNIHMNKIVKSETVIFFVSREERIMDADNEIVVQGHQLGNQLIVHAACHDVQRGYRAVLPAHGKRAGGAKIKAAGGNEILGVQPGREQP